MRRKAILAASFIVTVGIGCQKSGDSEVMHVNPPPTPRPSETTPTPTPSETTPPPSNDDTSIQQMPDGKCIRMAKPVPCPPGVMCNPPPPMEVPCPPDAGK